MKSIFLKTLSLSPFRLKPKNQRIRVADILAEEDDDDDDDSVLGFGMDWRRRSDGSTSLQCSSPRRVIARWLGSLRRGKERNIVVRTQKREVGEEVCKSGRGSRLINGLDGGSDSSPSASETEGSGQCRKDASFNLGVGCSLLYLIAASKNELTKMGELQKQMETLLQNVKGESKDAMSKAIESDVTLAYSTTDPQEGSNSNDRLSLQSQTTSIALTDSETTIVPQQEEYVEGIDELEAEFEAELERLQIHLDGENLLKPSQQQGIRVTVKDIASNRSCSLSFREAIDPQNSGTEVHCGVPHTELERRLHELLEARQQERIKELEAALERAMLKLREKEAEISWWKDTARLLSQHVPGSSLLSSHHNPVIT